MSKILCVLYDDPVDGYPPAYPRDEIPKIERYPTGRRRPPRSGSTSRRASFWGASRASSGCGFLEGAGTS